MRRAGDAGLHNGGSAHMATDKHGGQDWGSRLGVKAWGGGACEGLRGLARRRTRQPG